MSRRVGRRHSRRTEQRIRRHIDQRFADVVRLVARMIEAMSAEQPVAFVLQRLPTVEPSLDDLDAEAIRRRVEGQG